MVRNTESNGVRVGGFACCRASCSLPCYAGDVVGGGMVEVIHPCLSSMDDVILRPEREQHLNYFYEQSDGWDNLILLFYF